jgi:hypothetical protein
VAMLMIAMFARAGEGTLCVLMPFCLSLPVLGCRLRCFR